ncbi:MAG: hypothetical protein RI885_1119 [Actinomycetota bacterium]
MDITERTIFIPGATSGIGLALALRFQAAGNRVIIGGRRAELLDELAAEHGLATVRIDTADATSIRDASAEVLRTHPDLDTLILMAGIMHAEDWHSPDGFAESAEQIVTTNILGPIRLIGGFIEHLRGRRSATIMTVSSGLAFVPLAITPTYNASKAFIHRLSESIRLQLADTSVEVVELVPPSVQTELMPGHDDDESAMPLDAYADEVMHILATTPDVREVLVERVGFLRFAEARGDYDSVVAMLNGGGTAGHPAER